MEDNTGTYNRKDSDDEPVMSGGDCNNDNNAGGGDGCMQQGNITKHVAAGGQAYMRAAPRAHELASMLAHDNGN